MACLAIVIENQRASGFFPGPHDFAERLLPNPTVCAIQGKRMTNDAPMWIRTMDSKAKSPDEPDLQSQVQILQDTGKCVK